MKCVAPIVLVIAGSCWEARAADRPEGIPVEYRLLYQQDFEKPEALRDFVFTEPGEWRIGRNEKNAWLELHYDPKSKTIYKPKHRSPFHMALIADREFGNFVLEADMQSSIKLYPHQDMCLFYGFLSPDRFYYTHLAVAADAHAHNCFIVNDEPRKAIAKETTKGITWVENKWHKVRIVRNGSLGTTEVYFDDLKKSIMRAEDKTFARGLVGVGSFDDTGRIDNIRVWGNSVVEKKTEFFHKAK